MYIIRPCNKELFNRDRSIPAGEIPVSRNSLSCERIVVLEFLEEVFSGWRLFEIVVSLCVPANTICYNCAVDNNETKITFQIFRN